MRVRLIAAKSVMYLCLALYVIFLSFPFFWMLSTSLKPNVELGALTPTLIPKAPTIEHYIDAITEQQIARSVLNSLKVATGAAALTLVVAMPAAYAVARFRSRLNRMVQGWVLLSQIFPTILIIIPLFLILRTLSLTNSHYGLIAVYLVWGLPFSLWMLQGYVRSIPVELEEAAAVDGANRWQIIARIVAPLLVPGLVAAGLFAFINAWNEFFFALVLLKDPKLGTLPIGLAKFTGLEGAARWGPLAAASFLATIPSLVMFSFIQRGLTSGLLSGGVKQ